MPENVPWGDMSLGSPTAGDTASLRFVRVEQASVGDRILVVFAGVACPSFVILHRSLTIGRGPECDVVVADAAASRVHMRVTPVGNGIQITDLGSHNGTFVDGKRVAETTVAGPAIVRAGQSLMLLTQTCEPWQPPVPEGPLVGGTSLSGIRRQIKLVGPTHLPVLITGETGTGKEVIARMFHSASGRVGPLIAVNCAALPETLVESEFFGHTRGAFTGATQTRRGLFASAAGGTLFLDEVGDIPAVAQAKLLRVIEDGMIRAVGSEAEQRVDVRVLSATNRDLALQVEQGRFRRDLFARLSAVQLRLPALRERPEDLPALVRFLLDRASAQGTIVDVEALEAMALYGWPMNVRELDSVLRTSLLSSNGRTITLADLPVHVRTPPDGAPTRRDAGRGRSDLRLEVEAALRAHGGNVRQASLALGLARSHVYRLLKQWSIEPTTFRQPREEARGEP